jgi:hypothetical protein
MSDISQVQFNPKELLNLYLNQEYEQLSETLITILTHFQKVTYFRLDQQSQYFINVFIKNFLYLFTQPDYLISDRYVFPFIQLNPTISNLVAISSFKNTDFCLEILQDQERNFVKILTLYSPRNTVKFDYNILFNAQPTFACLWYSLFWENSRSLFVNRECWQNLKDHLAYRQEKLTDFYNIANIYSSINYLDINRSRELKIIINQSIQQSSSYKNYPINNNPNPKKFAIITCSWYPENTVYRNISGWLESLKNDYELTLIHLGYPHPNLDTHIFKNVIYLTNESGNLNLEILQNNEFMTIFYPDLENSPESIILANLRIAPIQIIGLGNSLSNWGSKIDYYLSSLALENSEYPENNYAERLVLLPGSGHLNQPISYAIQNRNKTRTDLIINFPLISQQLNVNFLNIFSKIIQQSHRKILLRFFFKQTDSLIKNNNYLPFIKELESRLGQDNFEIILDKSYSEYMALMEEGDFCIDAYHFGEVNSVVDSLYLRKPLITLAGKQSYNRIVSQMLKSLGLEELIATNSNDYLRLILKLIHQDQYRLSLQKRLQEIDLEQTIFNQKEQDHFKKAIDYLVTSHHQLKREQSKQPIIIH